MSPKLKLTALMALLISVAGTNGALAEPAHHPFVKSPFYHGNKGGRAVPLHLFAQDPTRYMRSPEAYRQLLQHVTTALERTVDDSGFRSLIVGPEARLIDCQGSINTAGITNAGQVGWRERQCYPGEYLIQVRLPGGWMTIASQGCYNPVRSARPADPPPSPIAGACGSNAKRYSATETAWPTGGKFCASGEQSSSNIQFPQPGRFTPWICSGRNSGPSASCEAPRDAAPTPPPLVAVAPPNRVCQWVPVSYGTSSTQQFSNTPPGMLMQYCDDTKRWIPGVTSTIGGGEVSTGTLVEVCEGGVAK